MKWVLINIQSLIIKISLSLIYNEEVIKIGFEVLTAVSTEMAVFWFVAPCSLSLMMEAARTSETLVNFYQTTRPYNPEDSHFPNIQDHTILNTENLMFL
jgi:hypothetical protein